jgi:hypothetical protein
MQSDAARFAWVRKRDGRQVPFDADKISRALFAASETLGRPDAFLARELTDGVLHFLAAEHGGTIPTTEQIAELVVKVVRELGQPALARAFADATAANEEAAKPPRPGVPGSVPTDKRLASAEIASWAQAGLPALEIAWRLTETALRDYALRDVFTRDLIAAQTDGLLELLGLEAPLELAGSMLPNTLASGVDLVEAIASARLVAGQYLVIDGAEYQLSRRGCTTPEVSALVRALQLGLRQMHLHAVLNLNCAVPPPQSEELAMGPLFEAHRHPPEPQERDALRDALLEECVRTEPGSNRVRVDWHLGARDFLPTPSPPLGRLARWLLEGAPLCFVFHRPRRPVPLAEGMDRQHTAVLQAVGLHLPRLQQLAGTVDEARFLQKLGSLARLALSAGTQKREFLRRQSRGRPALTAAFLVERARLMVVPLGLEAVVRAWYSQGMCSGGAPLELARRILEHLHDVLRDDGRACLLDSALDAGLPGPLPSMDIAGLDVQAPGPTPWDRTAPVRSQLRAAGALHAAAEMGTATIFLPSGPPLSIEEIADFLQYAWQQTEVVRLRFVGRTEAPRQLLAPWA